MVVDSEITCGSESALRQVGMTGSSTGSRNSKAVAFHKEPCKQLICVGNPLWFKRGGH